MIGKFGEPEIDILQKQKIFLPGQWLERDGWRLLESLELRSSETRSIEKVLIALYGCQEVNMSASCSAEKVLSVLEIVRAWRFGTGQVGAYYMYLSTYVGAPCVDSTRFIDLKISMKFRRHRYSMKKGGF